MSVPRSTSRTKRPVSGLVFSSRGLAVKRLRKYYFIVLHEASGLPITHEGYDTRQKAITALDRLLPITNWTRPLDDIPSSDLVRASEVLYELAREAP